MAELSVQIKLKAFDEVSVRFANIVSAGNRLSQVFDENREKLKQLNQTGRKLQAFEELKQKTNNTSQALNQARERVQRLHQELQRGSAGRNARQMDELRQQYERARRAADSLQRTHTGQRQRLSALNNELREAGINTSQLASEQQRLQRNSQALITTMERQRRAMERIAQIREQTERSRAGWQNIRDKSAMVAVSGAMALALPVREFAEAEDAAMSLKVSMMNNLGQIPPEFDKINALAEKLGTSLPGSTAEFSGMMAKLVQQGISFQDILGGVGEASANLAVVMKMPFADAAEFAAKMQDATKTSADDMIDLMDTIQKSYYLGVDSTNMLSGFSKISDGMKTIRMQGLEGAKAMAPLLVMADQASMAGESAGNAFSKIFKAMMDTDDIAKALKGTGMSMNFTDGKGEFGGLDNMFAQLEKLKGLTTEDRLPLLSDMFGNDSETIQALNLLIDKGKAGYEETIAKMQSQADLQKRVNTQLSTLANIWDAAKGTFSSVMVGFGEALAPELKNIIGFMTEVTESVGQWAKENPVLAGTLVKVVAGVTVLAVALAGIATVMLTIVGPLALLKTAFVTLSGLGTGVAMITKIGTAFTWLGGIVRAVGLAMMANPILLAVAAIAVAAFLIYQNWEPIKAFFINLWNSLPSIVQSAINLIKTVITNFSPVGIFINIFGAVLSYLSGLGGQFSAYGANLIDGLKNGIMSRVGAVVAAISGVVAQVKSAFTGAKGMDIHSPSRVFKAYGGFMMQGLDQGLTGNAKNVIHTTQGLTDKIKDGMTHIVPNHTSITGAVTGGQGYMGAGVAPASIIININGATDPQAVARAVQSELARVQASQMARERRRMMD